ncbi:MAG: ABC transporter permease [Deltaproteobacteria bacterium]|nr:ABC transporter permease [Deltaproteobacteria bacterium]
MSIKRILSYTMRHVYLYKRSLPRLMEIFYWPLVDILVWGFVSVYLSTTYKGTLPNFVAFFIGALILWDVLFRSQQAISVSFLEDMWSRNLLNLFVSPLTTFEYITSLLLISIMKLILASGVMVLIAYFLYSFNIFTFGMHLIPFIINLVVMGWAVGIVTMSIILRYGQEAEVLAWGIAFLFQPFSAVFYPVSVLPIFMQKIAFFVPSSHVFEGMRHVIASGTLPIENILWASGLNVVYIIAAILFFNWNFKTIKRDGLLTKVGE